MLYLKDNSRVPREYQGKSLIKNLVDRDLLDLMKENIIIFPPTIKESADLEESQCPFFQRNQEIYTGNIAGFLRDGSDELKIDSRFFQNSEEGEDYFLRYMLEKVLNYNVTSSLHGADKEDSSLDLLAFLFPYYLNDALKQGLYKEYVSKRYNDSNVKGPIDLARHVRKNMPFRGNITYNTREFQFDNPVTQLIRHAIEKLQMKVQFDCSNDELIRENIRTIKKHTESYRYFKREDVLKENLSRPVRQGYYAAYYQLQQLCILLLQEEAYRIGKNEMQINGVLMDVAWLWEEYLATFLSKHFIHAENKNKRNGFSLFADRTRQVYPDFYQPKVAILDAKYKRLDGNDSMEESKKIAREDLYQLTTYLHTLEAAKAGVIFPSESKTDYHHVGLLEGGGHIFKIGVGIPKDSRSYEEFRQEMGLIEEKVIDLVKETLDEPVNE